MTVQASNLYLHPPFLQLQSIS